MSDATEPLRVTLHKARETKNTVRFEEPEGGEPPVIGTLYVQKWATHRLGDPETIAVVIEAAGTGATGAEGQP